MKLSENLKKIRKEDNVSQEQLAEQLGVSRQAVSKWESGQSYPEMDKVLNICKLYNYNIDELLNENVTSIKEEKESKSNFNKLIEEILLYITKTVNMFSSMKFKQKVKCIFEQFIIAFCIVIIFAIVGIIGSEIVRFLFSFLPNKIYYFVRDVLSSAYLIFCLVSGIAVLLHVFKIRYLDYYTFAKEENNVDNIVEKNAEDNETKSEVKLDKDREKIIIRDPAHSESKFFNAIAKVIVFSFKAFVCLVLGFFAFCLIGLVVGVVCSFLIAKSGVFFVGLLLSLIGAIIGNVIILEILFDFIVNRKASKTRIGISFLIALIVCGIGLGLGAIGISKFKIVDELSKENIKTFEYEYDMTDDTRISTVYELNYIESSNKNIKIELEAFKYNNIYVDKNVDDSIYIWGNIGNYDLIDTLTLLKDDINNKTIYKSEYMKVNVYTTKENIQKLKENNSTKSRIEMMQDTIDELETTIREKDDTINNLQEKINSFELENNNI